MIYLLLTRSFEVSTTALSKVTRGIIHRPFLLLMYGQDGVGKTSWGAKMPNPIFIGAETGSDLLDVARFPQPQTFDEILAYVHELTTSVHDYKTVVFDTLDWIEPLIFKKICIRHKARSIATAAGGFGNGYVEAGNEWKTLIEAVTNLRDSRQMNILFLCHALAVDFNDPEAQATYKRYELKLDKRSAPLFKEYVDAVLFASHETFIKEDGAKTQAITSDNRLMYTVRHAGFDAKNRYGLPSVMPLDIPWDDFVAAARTQESAESLLKKIEVLIPFIKEDIKETVTKSVADAKNDSKRLGALYGRIKELTANIASG